MAYIKHSCSLVQSSIVMKQDYQEDSIGLSTMQLVYRTMRPGLSNDLQQISDSRKTAIIDSELDRLNIYIAILHETRLAEMDH